MEDNLVTTIKDAIGIVIDLIRAAAEALLETKFAMVMPLTRLAVKWYTNKFDLIYQTYLF